MINVPRVAEPLEFDEKCRQPGAAWLKEHPPQPNTKQSSPPGYWRGFKEDVKNEFRSRCGYYAMYIHDGEIDHFVPWSQNPQLGFEWTNLRFIDASLNKKKGKESLLDPFNVQDEWFEVEIPSLYLVITPALTDPAIRKLAEDTVERLDLKRGDTARRMRAKVYEEYRRNHDMIQLEYQAPLVARAVRNWQHDHPEKPLPDCSAFLRKYQRIV